MEFFFFKLSVGFAALQVFEDRLMPRLARSPVVMLWYLGVEACCKTKYHAPFRMPRPSFELLTVFSDDRVRDPKSAYDMNFCTSCSIILVLASETASIHLVK